MISKTVVDRMRRSLGLTGNIRGKPGKPKAAAKRKAAATKPKEETATLGKTGFVKEFLNDNPQANARAVNEAWQAAGMNGTISHPVISLMRKQLGLTGNQPGTTKQKASQAKPRTWQGEGNDS